MWCKHCGYEDPSVSAETRGRGYEWGYIVVEDIEGGYWYFDCVEESEVDADETTFSCRECEREAGSLSDLFTNDPPYELVSLTDRKIVRFDQYETVQARNIKPGDYYAPESDGKYVYFHRGWTDEDEYEFVCAIFNRDGTLIDDHDKTTWDWDDETELFLFAPAIEGQPVTPEIVRSPVIEFTTGSADEQPARLADYIKEEVTA